MKHFRNPVILAIVVSVIVVAALNFALVGELNDFRDAYGQAALGRTLPASPEETEYTLYLVFSPAQCSSHFRSELDDWRRVFDRFHGSRVWVEYIAAYTSRAELGRAWEAMDTKLPVYVDPDGAMVRGLGLRGTPAKILVHNPTGQVAYREEFPELYEVSRIETVLETVLQAPPWTPAAGSPDVDDVDAAGIDRSDGGTPLG